MNELIKFYNDTHLELIRRGEHPISASSYMEIIINEMGIIINERERILFNNPSSLDDFAEAINERYKNIIAKHFITPFGKCVMLVEKNMVKEYTEWLKTKNFDEIL